MKHMNNQKIKIDPHLLLFFIAVLAIAVRIYRFGIVPGGMNQDGAMAAVDAKAIAEYGTDRFGMRYPVHLTAWGFGQMSALMSYLMALPIRLFGLSVFSARLPMLLVSLFSLVILYFFVQDLSDMETALAVVFFAAIDPWHIIQSRWALDCNLFPHFLLAGVFFLNRAAEKNRAYLVPSMVMFAMSMYCYGISIYTVPVLLLVSCILLLLRRKITAGQAVGAAAVYFLLAWPFLICMMINTFRLPTIETPLFTIPFFPNSMRSGDILFFSDDPLRQLGRNALSTLRILFQQYNNAICNEVKGYGSLYVFSIPFMLYGGFLYFRNFKKNTGYALTILWFMTALFAGLITANVNINRINILFYPLILFTGTGIRDICRRFLSSRKLKAAAMVLPLVYLIAFGFFVHAYFTSYARQISSVFMQDFGRAVAAVRGSDADRVYISADAQYKGYAHVSEILTLFYLDIDAEEYQSPAFTGRFTFRIPQDPDPAENAVYVAARSDLPYFDPLLYDIEDFGTFLVIRPD